ISPCVPIFDLKIAAFDPTRISHAQPKRSDTRVRFGIIFGDPKQYANPPQSFGLLRSQCKRPCGRRTNKRDEVAPPHCLPRGSDRASYRVTGRLEVVRLTLGNVRFGSKADMAAHSLDVRFTPKSGHWNSVAKCPLCAKSGHMQCSNSRSIGAGTDVFLPA